MPIQPTVSAYGGGISQFPVFLNRTMTNYQFDKTERDLARTINENVRNAPGRRLTIQTLNEVLPNVVGARKMPNQSAIGSENYTDVIVNFAGGRSAKINTRGTFAPSQILPDARTIFGAAPAMTKKFLRTAITKLKSMGLRDGQLAPTNMQPLYAELRGENNRKIVTGTAQVGGPIDYIFEGATQGQYDPEQNVLSMQANLTSALALSKTQRYYINMAPPRAGSRMMFNRNDNFGMPMIFDNGGRQLSIVDRSFIPAGSKVIRI